MKIFNRITAFLIFSVLIFNLSAAKINAQQNNNAKQQENCIQTEKVVIVNPLDLIDQPDSYLKKEVKIKAKFHKFSTLGLDYDKAMRSSKDYISVLIKRPDVSESYTIPLSELKLIIKREEAEELMDMESGDTVEIRGKVFSAALNDPWIDIYELKSLEPEKAEKSKPAQKAKK